MADTNKFISVAFEVHGRVQGVFFRKYTQQQAKLLDLKGYCLNTDHGTVQGVIEGKPDKIAQMKEWLQKVGSPSSKIDKVVFKSEQDIKNLQTNSFQIRR